MPSSLYCFSSRLLAATRISLNGSLLALFSGSLIVLFSQMRTASALRQSSNTFLSVA